MRPAPNALAPNRAAIPTGPGIKEAAAEANLCFFTKFKHLALDGLGAIAPAQKKNKFDFLI